MNELTDVNKLNFLIKKGATVSEICEKTHISFCDLKIYLSLLEKKYTIKDDQLILTQPEVQIKQYLLQDKEKYRILFISDTHLGGNIDNIDALKYVYKKAEENNVDIIIHLGDLTDGISKYQQNLKCKNYNSLLNYVIRYYPYSNIQTIIISGNHDLWFRENEKANIVMEICENRGDLTYLGKEPVVLKFLYQNFLLAHGDAGLDNYTLLAEQINAQYFLYGHTHRSGLKVMNNINYVNVPCLCFPRYSKGSQEQIGSCWFDIDKNVNY